MNTEKPQISARPPVIAIMGHIDHGKSTLLSYIRKSTKPLNEAGGITQHISAYEVEHTGSDGQKQSITFLDTPGHEAFRGIRSRGANVADIAILIVSAEDGVKPQTVEAQSAILKSKIPYIVAITKIDKPEANIDRVKQSLAENEIYVEGYGGSIPCVPLSSKTGEGVPELLDMITLVAEIENLTASASLLGHGVILESNRDIKKGISATCIIKDGHLAKGMFIVSGTNFAPVRIMENYLGKQVDTAGPSSPVKIIGWDSLPEVGSVFQAYATREEANEVIEKEKEKKTDNTQSQNNSLFTVPIIVKADTGSSLEAVLYEIKKLGNENISAQVIYSGIGTISENDIRFASGDKEKKATIIGFNVSVESLAKNLAERQEVEIKTFDIIYKISEWLTLLLKERAPKVRTEESTGKAKILKIFSKVKDKQILGARVLEGSIKLGAQVKISRRGEEIGMGKIRELQQQKNKTDEVKENTEFGAMIEAKVEIATGDQIESFIITEK